METRFLSTRISRKRIITACTLIIALGAFLFLLDSLVAAVPLARDFDVAWAPDGKSMAFARFKLYDSREKSHWELHVAGRRGENPSLLFSVPAEFGANSLRSISYTPDGAFLVVRLNTVGRVVEDYIMTVPVTRKGKADTWHLNKTHRWDAFLAAASGTAALRRYSSTGGGVENIIELHSLPGRRLLYSYTVPEKGECLLLALSGDGKRACAVVIAGKRKGERVSLHMLDIERRRVEAVIPIFHYPMALGFLKDGLVYMQIDIGGKGCLQTVDIKTRNITTVFSAATEDVSMTCSARSGLDRILIVRDRLLFIYDLKDKTLKRSPLFERRLYQAALHPDGSMILLSDNFSLMLCDASGGSAATLGCADPAAALGRNAAFNSLKSTRGKVIWKLYKTLFPAEVEKLRRSREYVLTEDVLRHEEGDH